MPGKEVSAENIPPPSGSELEACRPIMASEWPSAGKGCPAELQTAVTMENLPSRPRRLPAGLHAWLQSRCPHLPPAEPNGLSHAHGRLCRLGPGEGQLVPGWPNRPAAHLVWVRGGAGRKEVQELRLMELEGALGILEALSAETQTREGEHCPGPHSTEEDNTPTPAPPSGSWGQLGTQDVFLGRRPAPDAPTRAQVYAQARVLLPPSQQLGTSLSDSEPLK